MKSLLLLLKISNIKVVDIPGKIQLKIWPFLYLCSMKCGKTYSFNILPDNKSEIMFVILLKNITLYFSC